MIQFKLNLFGVVFVMDEFLLGFYFCDVEGFIYVFYNIIDMGNLLFVVEYNFYVIKGVNWVVDVGLKVGVNGGEFVYSGLVKELVSIKNFLMVDYVFNNKVLSQCIKCKLLGGLCLKDVFRNNVSYVDIDILLGVMICVIGVFGFGKLSLIS